MKAKKSKQAKAKKPKEEPFQFERIYGALKGTVTIMPGVDLTEPIGGTWDAQEQSCEAPNSAGMGKVKAKKSKQAKTKKLKEEPFEFESAYGTLKGTLTVMPGMGLSKPTGVKWDAQK